MRMFIKFILSIIFISLVKRSFSQKEDSLILSNAVLHYYSYGQGTPILILSGGPGISSHQEDDLAINLSKKYCAILFDQRGTGKSWTKPFDRTTINLKQAVEDIDLLRKHLKINKLNISGHSWGAMLASAYTAKYPDHVNLLLLIGGGPIDISVAEDISKNINLRAQLADTSIINYWRDSVNAKSNPELATHILRKYGVKHYIYDTSQLDKVMIQVEHGTVNFRMASFMVKDLVAINMNLIDALHKYQRPALIIFGWEDPVGITTLSQYMKAFPHAQLEGIHDCGHFYSVEQPTVFFPIVDDFFEKYLH